MKKYIISLVLLSSFLLSAYTINIERDGENNEKTEIYMPDSFMMLLLLIHNNVSVSF